MDNELRNNANIAEVTAPTQSETQLERDKGIGNIILQESLDLGLIGPKLDASIKKYFESVREYSRAFGPEPPPEVLRELPRLYENSLIDNLIRNTANKEPGTMDSPELFHSLLSLPIWPAKDGMAMTCEAYLRDYYAAIPGLDIQVLFATGSTDPQIIKELERNINIAPDQRSLDEYLLKADKVPYLQISYNGSAKKVPLVVSKDLPSFGMTCERGDSITMLFRNPILARESKSLLDQMATIAHETDHAVSAVVQKSPLQKYENARNQVMAQMNSLNMQYENCNDIDLLNIISSQLAELTTQLNVTPI